MSGRVNGVHLKLKAECLQLLYALCGNHAFDLVLKEVGKEVNLTAEALNFVQGVAVVGKLHKKDLV